MLGLAVVNQLASRNGIVVTLGPNFGMGTVAEVRLPSSVLAISSRHPVAFLPAASRRAAPELRQAVAGGRTDPAWLGASDTPAVSGPGNQLFAWPEWTPGHASNGRPSDAAFAPPANGRPPGGPAATVEIPVALPATSIGLPTVPAQREAPETVSSDLPVAGSSEPPVDDAEEIAPQSSDAPVADDLAKAETAEIPIFREVAAGWFQGHVDSALEDLTDVATQATTAPQPEDLRIENEGGAGSDPLAGSMPQPATPADPVTSDEPRPDRATTPPVSWSTAADEGWQAAEAVAAPRTSGTTRSGLAKRLPAANLVPGGVELLPRGKRSQRTPERVRGQLLAYHRGLQRGRTAVEDSLGETGNDATGDEEKTQ